MKKRTRATYSPVDKWARQLRHERNVQLSSATPLTPD